MFSNNSPTRSVASVLVLVLAGSSVRAEGPEIPDHHFSKAVLNIDVARPAEQAWAVVGQFCDITKWLSVPCKLVGGPANDVGTVRELMGTIHEVMTSKTPLSYTYAALDDSSSPQRFIHGALEVRALDRRHCRIIYTLIYDDFRVPNTADRDRDLAQRSAFLTQGLQRMKSLSEGGQ